MIKDLIFILDKKDKSVSRPFIIDIKELYNNNDIDTIKYKYLDNTTYRQDIINQLLIFGLSNMLIITKEGSFEKIKKMDRRDYLLEEHFFEFYIEEKLWAVGVDDRIVFKKESKEKKTISNKEVLAMDKCTNAVKFIVSIGEGFGMDNFFTENEFGEPIVVKGLANEILELLNCTKIE